jgi:hypothetical protein
VLRGVATGEAHESGCAVEYLGRAFDRRSRKCAIRFWHVQLPRLLIPPRHRLIEVQRDLRRRCGLMGLFSAWAMSLPNLICTIGSAKNSFTPGGRDANNSAISARTLRLDWPKNRPRERWASEARAPPFLPSIAVNIAFDQTFRTAGGSRRRFPRCTVFSRRPEWSPRPSSRLKYQD